MLRLWSLVGLAVALLTGTVLPAFAQAPVTGRTYRGLFGSGLQGTNQSLVFDGTLGGGLDTNVFIAEPVVAGDPTTTSKSRGTFGNGSAALFYHLKLSKVSVDARARAAASHYSERVQRGLVKTYGGEFGASAPLWSGANVSVNHSLQFHPFYYLPWLVGVVGAEESSGPGPSIDETAGAFIEYHTNSATSASLTQNLTRRFGLTFSYGYQQSSSGSGVRDMTAQNGSAGMNFAVGKGLGLRLGYGFTEGRYAATQSYRARNIDAGLNFSKALSLTRKTQLSFTTGTTSVFDENQTFFHFDAHVRLSHELGRTWTAQLIYNRDVSFDDTFRVPVPLDAFNIGVRGLISRRLAFNAAAGSVTGALGFNAQANGFETYYGRSGLVWGLSQALGLGLDYTYFQYRFDGQNGLPVGLIRRADRHHLRAFVTVRAALFKGQNRGGR